MEKQTEIIRSVSTDQTEILKWIMKLYVPDGFEADSTYSKGGFYKDIPPPRLRFDLNPQSKDVIQADCRELPLADESISSLMFDPPFLATTGKSLKEDKGNIINRRFTVCKSETELQYLPIFVKEAASAEAGRYFVLMGQGFLGKQWMHCCVYDLAMKNGFEASLFVLMEVTALPTGSGIRNTHEIPFVFWVFRKKKHQMMCKRSCRLLSK